jgi:hypothetical protein
MAALVERFDAGVIVEDPRPEALWEACRVLIADYPRYRENARRGGERIRRENSWAPLIAALQEE